MTRKIPVINMDSIRRYLNHLKEQERSATLFDWKQALVRQYAPASVDSMLWFEKQSCRKIAPKS